MSTFNSCLETVANLAEVLTAAVALFAYLYYRREQSRKRERLEQYLKAERDKNPEKRTHTILHVMAMVALTYDEVLRAGFQSKHIEHVVHANRDTGLADDILLKYKD